MVKNVALRPTRRAIKRTMVDANGKSRTVYVDLSTFQFIDPQNLEGYKIVNEASNVLEQVNDVLNPTEVQGVITQKGTDDDEWIKKIGPQTNQDKTGSKTTRTDGGRISTPTSAVGLQDRPDTSRQGFTTDNFSGRPGVVSDNLGFQSNFPDRPNVQGNNLPGKPDSVFAGRPEVVGDNKSGGVATAETSSGKTSKGGGFADLTESADKAMNDAVGKGGGLSFSHPEQEAGLGSIKGDLEGTGLEMGRDFNVNSGYRSPAYNAMVSNTGRTGFHTKGKAADIDMTGWSETEKRDFIQEMSQRGGRGFVTYSKLPNVIHVDKRNLDKPHFMFDETKDKMDKAPGWYQQMAQEVKEFGTFATPANAPTPTGNPAKETNTAKALESSKEAVQARDVNAPFDPATATPAQFAAMGFTTRSPEDRSLIAETLAGELSPTQLRELEAGNPKAVQEFANMMTTIENRAASKMFEDKGVKGVVAPSQYNSRSTVANAKGFIPMETTKQNYSLYGKTLNKLTDDFYGGKLQPSSWGLTSYHNPSISKPSWSNQMQGIANVGGHKFGSLPEYGPGQGFLADRQAMSDGKSFGYGGNGSSGGVVSDEGFGNNTGFTGRSDPGQASGYSGGGNSGGVTSSENAGVSTGGGAGRGSSIGGPSISDGYDSVGTPEDNDSSYGGPR